MRIMLVFTSFGGLEKTGGFAQTIVMSTNPKVDDPRSRPNHVPCVGPHTRERHRHGLCSVGHGGCDSQTSGRKPRDLGSIWPGSGSRQQRQTTLPVYRSSTFPCLL